MRLPLLGLAAFLSGVAALVYQFLWIRRLGEAFGHTAYAVNVVLAVFFLGLGLGAWIFGRTADRGQGSIRLYCALEIAIASYGLLFGMLADGVEGLYLSFAPAEWPLSASLLFKGAASVLLLAVPTLAMGGTLPAILRHAVRSSNEVGARVGWLYGWNTVGAAVGAALAGLVLIPRFGVAGATGAAVAANLLAAGFAWTGRRRDLEHARAALPRTTPDGRRSRVLLTAAAISGFVTVGLEVLWTRALASRFLNTVYSFATILLVFLLALGIASLATAWLDRRGWVKRPTLALATMLGGALGLVSILLLSRLPTSWGEGTGSSVPGFLLRELRSSVAVMALPVLALGLSFPLLVRLAHAEVGAIGREAGAVYLANTIGSVAAPLLVGFAALPHLGLKTSLVLLSWIAILFGACVLVPWSRLARRPATALAAGAIVLGAALHLGLPADIRLWRTSPGDELVEYREGVTASLAVLHEPSGDLVLKLNNDYVLGGLKGAELPHREALIPLLLHESPRSALFIGLGTGASAGAAAAWGDLSVDILEIVPEVVLVIGRFRESNEDLLERARVSPAVRILEVDGRHFVRATDRRYDVVVGDLFLPYRAGEGAMYTREHLDSVRRVLAPAGLFCQWLPLYQFRPEDLRVVVRTFCDVFPSVEAVWLFPSARQPVLGLIGTNEPLAVAETSLESRLRDPARAALLARSGLTEVEPLLAGWIASRPALLTWSSGAPVETRGRPRIEFSAPLNVVAAPEDPSTRNVLDLLALTRPVSEATVLTWDPVEGKQRIEAHQRALIRFLRAGCSLASGETIGAALDEMAPALADTPEWDLIPAQIKSLARSAVDARDFGAARKAAGILQQTPTQRHAGLYLEALVAWRTGDATLAHRLARAALDLKPDHAPTLELLKELESGPAVIPR